MSDEFRYDNDSSIDYYEVLGVQQFSSRSEIWMKFHQLSNGDCNLQNITDSEKVKLFKRAAKVLTSPRLKKEYNRKRANISEQFSGKSDRRTSFSEWVNSCSNTSPGRLSDPDISSVSSVVASESDGESSWSFERGWTNSQEISYDKELGNLTIEQKKTEKNEIKTKVEFVKNNINDSVSKEAQPTSISTQDQPRESSSKKRNLSSSSSCAEMTSELNSTQKTQRKKGKKKKKKSDSFIKRILQKLR